MIGYLPRLCRGRSHNINCQRLEPEAYLAQFLYLLLTFTYADNKLNNAVIAEAIAIKSRIGFLLSGVKHGAALQVVYCLQSALFFS
jgi:hypothetical protein